VTRRLAGAAGDAVDASSSNSHSDRRRQRAARPNFITVKHTIPRRRAGAVNVAPRPLAQASSGSSTSTGGGWFFTFSRNCS
jgi:hypothetical protein